MSEQSIKNLKRFNSNYVKSDILRAVNDKIWDYPEFTEWPGSIGQHHSYKGGLIIHTEEVWNYCFALGDVFNFDIDILFTAVLWHDLAKIFDYKKMKVGTYSLVEVKEGDVKTDNDFFVWEKSDYHSNIHHITGSIAEFTRHALNLGLDRCTLEKIQHCMAGHHGYPEWRSPVTPKSLEAIILHQSDMLSATYGHRKDK